MTGIINTARFSQSYDKLYVAN